MSEMIKDCTNCRHEDSPDEYPGDRCFDCLRAESIDKYWELELISVTKNNYDGCPDWVKQCPCCQNENSDVFIEISSLGLYVHFALCKKCRNDLADKLQLGGSNE